MYLKLLVFVIFLNVTVLYSNSYFLEAEDALLNGVTISKSRSGYSGSGFVTGFDADGDHVEFRFDGSDGLYELIIGYASPHGEKGYDLSVNGVKSTGMLSGPQKTFAKHNAGKVKIIKGQNSIIIGKGWGWYDVDYIELRSGQVRLPQKTEKALAAANSDQSTQALFDYLVDLYGHKILSGQQDLEDIEYIESKTGKSPVVGCFDLIDYSPSRVEHGSNPAGNSEKWIDWALQGGGMVSLSWHWNAPTDLIDQPGKEWWRGFYTHSTTFDLKAALADKSSERYKLLLRDMDVIAEELYKFQQFDVPVLWRPLHEAAGGWFWWGAKGADPYIELWRLMFDRFTNVHELTNLIWVCTPNSFDWYPGDDVVDIVGLDIYTDQSSPMSGEWDGALNHMDGIKMISLSESGTLPDPENVRAFGTWWSWFSVWTGSFIRDVPLSLLQKTYDDTDVITLDELPDWRQYTRVSTIQNSEFNVALSVFPNPSNSRVTLRYSLQSLTNISIELFNARGQKVSILYSGEMERGDHTLPVEGVSVSGIYWVRVTTGSTSVSEKLLILK